MRESYTEEMLSQTATRFQRRETISREQKQKRSEKQKERKRNKRLILGTTDAGSMHLLGLELPSKSGLLVDIVSRVDSTALFTRLSTVNQVKL